MDMEMHQAHEGHADATEAARAAAIYTCPMHPEVRQNHPGACPKCGMALEPETPTLDEGENPELLDFKRVGRSSSAGCNRCFIAARTCGR